MQRERVLFFDLELTGIYDHDEILSISIVDATGKVIMDTLIRPTHNKRWKRTEKIHGITPDMVVDAPTLAEVTPRVKEIFADAGPTSLLTAFPRITATSSTSTIPKRKGKRSIVRRVAAPMNSSAMPTSIAPISCICP